MQKSIGKEFENRMKRIAFLRDNCDAVEDLGYMKKFTKDEIQEHKDVLAAISVDIKDVEDRKKEANKLFKAEMDPLVEQRNEVVSDIKAKARFVKEEVFKFVDEKALMTGYYNADGDLVEERPATADEIQPNIYRLSKTGTDY